MGNLVDGIINSASYIDKMTRASGNGAWVVTSKQVADIMEEVMSEMISDSRDKKIDSVIMDKQTKYDTTYLKMAREWANLSHCKRKQVGAIVVKNGMIISDGYNGTPAKMDNNCEDCDGKTHWFVLHAEANAILKCAKHGQSCEGSTLYLTHSPCKDCSKLVLSSGIKRLVYIEKYKDTSGLDFLSDNGIEINQIDAI